MFLGLKLYKDFRVAFLHNTFIIRCAIKRYKLLYKYASNIILMLRKYRDNDDCFVQFLIS